MVVLADGRVGVVQSQDPQGTGHDLFVIRSADEDGSVTIASDEVTELRPRD